jgi:hypothetical protein
LVQRLRNCATRTGPPPAARLATDENARISEKLQAARSRIEALLKQIPETET